MVSTSKPRNIKYTVIYIRAENSVTIIDEDAARERRDAVGGSGDQKEHKTSDENKTTEENQSRGVSSSTLLKIGAVSIGAVGLGVAAIVAPPLIIGGLGFQAGGIAAGSTAAGMMSSAAIANGGAIAAGSAVAVLQSIGAVGFSAAATTAMGTGGALAGGGVGYGIARVFSKAYFKVDISCSYLKEGNLIYKVDVDTNIAGFPKKPYSVLKSHEDFTELLQSFTENIVNYVIPIAPEKASFVIELNEKLEAMSRIKAAGLTDVLKRTKKNIEEEYKEPFQKTVDSHKKCLECIAEQPVLRSDTNFKEFFSIEQ